jgi:hypothetical protein
MRITEDENEIWQKSGLKTMNISLFFRQKVKTNTHLLAGWDAVRVDNKDCNFMMVGGELP